MEDYTGLAAASPWLGAALVVSLLSLVGTPPTAVFLDKLGVFTAAWDGGLAWLVAVAAVNTGASLFYYLRWIAPAFRRDESTEHPERAAPFATAAAVLGGIGVLVLGILVVSIMPMVETALSAP